VFFFTCLRPGGIKQIIKCKNGRVTKRLVTTVNRFLTAKKKKKKKTNEKNQQIVANVKTEKHGENGRKSDG